MTTFRLRRRRSYKYFIVLLFAMSYYVGPYFLATLILFDTIGSFSERATSSNINVKEAGVVDTTSQWRKLGQATYVFTAYLDDRDPDAVLITVLGFDSKSEPFLNGTLLLHNGESIPLGRCKEKRTLNADGSLKQQQAYEYKWPLPAQVANTNYLKSILVQQFHQKNGKLQCPL